MLWMKGMNINMTDILIFGTGGGCQKVKMVLNYVNVNILAYIDNNAANIGKKIDSKPVIAVEDIIKFKWNYIIIASDSYDEILRQLLKIGVSESRIICFFRDYPLFEYFNLKMLSFDKKCKDSIEVLVTGMSYAANGINTNLLCKKAFSFALGSQDLFFDFNIIKYLFKNRPYVVSKIKYCIIDLCYFSFEYDMSRSGTKSIIFRYQELLHEKHNYDSIKFEKDYKEYREKLNLYSYLIDRMKYKDYLDDFAPNFNNSATINSNSQKLYTEQIARALSWINYQDELQVRAKEQVVKETRKNYPETVDENKKILKDYLELLLMNSIKPIIVVLPTHKYYYSNYPDFMKEEFYSIIQEFSSMYKFQFVDYFDYKLFNDNDFCDMVHLNKNGAKKMTDILNNVIKW